MSGSKTPLGARFAFQGQLSSQGGAPRWLAVEAATGKRVVAAVVSAGRVASLSAARGVQHRHLAGMLEVIPSSDAADLPPSLGAVAGSAIAIAEYVPGRALERQLSPSPLTPAKAVAWTLRLIDAVQALHQKGAVHGAISPWSVIAEPEGRAIAPALSQLLAPPVGAYCPPERLKGSSDAASDDVWALYATLYTALTGKPPFAAIERDALRKQMMAGRPKPLSDFGIDEPALSEIVMRGLMGEKRLRESDLSEFSKALDGWERDPRAMPARRPPAPRPTTTRGVADLLAAPSVADDGIVFDVGSLTVAGPSLSMGTAAVIPAVHPGVATAPMPAVSPPVIRVAAPVVSASPASLPALSASPPPLPVVSAPPPLPVVSAPPPLPVVSAPPPLPVVSAPPPLPSSTTAMSAGPELSALVAPPPQRAAANAPQASLESLVAQLPQAISAPFPAVVAPVRPPTPRRLSFNPFEKKRRLWPIVALAAAMGGLGMYVALGAGSAAPAPAVATAAPVAPPKPKAPEKPKLSVVEARDSCVRSYFPERAFASGAELGAICEEGDFRETSKRLFSLVKQQPLAARSGAEAAGAPEKSAAASVNLGWYELPAAAIIRKSCCASASAVVLPETVGWCEQLQSAVRRIADDSDKAGDVAPGARAFDKAVTCLYVHRINRPYTYERPPSEPQRREFQRFLSQAAISAARR